MKLLTKKEQRHLTEDARINSMAAMERQADFIKACLKQKDIAELPGIVCLDCKHIARKLGLLED